MTTRASMCVAATPNYTLGGVNQNDLLFYVTNSAQSMVFGLSNNPSVMTVRGTGNVGIGRSNPAYPLDVAGIVNLSSNVYVGGGMVVDGPVQVVNNFQCPCIDLINPGVNNGYTSSNNVVFSGAGYFSGSNITFSNPLGQASIYSLSNNIGINNPSPTQALDVFGNMHLSGYANFSSNVNIAGKLCVSNLEYITSNVTIFCSETVNSNLNVLNVLNSDTLSNSFGLSTSNLSVLNVFSSVTQSNSSGLSTANLSVLNVLSSITHSNSGCFSTNTLNSAALSNSGGLSTNNLSVAGNVVVAANVSTPIVTTTSIQFTCT